MAKEFSRAFYRSKHWRDFRRWYMEQRIAIDGGICECCRMEVGRELHHVVHLTPENINDPYISLNADNVMLLCYDCHQNEHYRADNGNGRYSFDEDGRIMF